MFFSISFAVWRCGAQRYGGNVIMEIFFGISLMGFLRLWSSTLLRRDAIANSQRAKAAE